MNPRLLESWEMPLLPHGVKEIRHRVTFPIYEREAASALAKHTPSDVYSWRAMRQEIGVPEELADQILVFMPENCVCGWLKREVIVSRERYVIDVLTVYTFGAYSKDLFNYHE